MLCAPHHLVAPLGCPSFCFWDKIENSGVHCREAFARAACLEIPEKFSVIFLKVVWEAVAGLKFGGENSFLWYTRLRLC